VGLRASAREFEFETNYAGEVVPVSAPAPAPASVPMPVAVAAPAAAPAAFPAPAVFVPSFVRPRHCFAAVESYSWKTMVCKDKSWDVNAAVIGGRETCASRDCISIHMEFWLKVDRFEYWLILPQGCEGSDLIFYDRVNPSSKGRVATLEAVVASAYNRRLAKKFSGQVGYLIEERARGIDVLAKYDAAKVEEEAQKAAAAFAAAAAAPLLPAAAAAAAPTAAVSAGASSSSGAKTVVASNVVLIPASKSGSASLRPSSHDFSPLENPHWKRLPCDKWWHVDRAEETGAKCHKHCEYMHREYWLPDPRDHSGSAYWFVAPGTRTILTDSCAEPRRRRHLEEAAAMPMNRKNRLLYAKEIAHFFPSLAEAQGTAPGAAAVAAAAPPSGADVRALASAAAAAAQPEDSFAGLSSAAAPVYLTLSRTLKAAGHKVPFAFEPVPGELWRLRLCKLYKPDSGSSMCSDGHICQFVHRHCTYACATHALFRSHGRALGQGGTFHLFFLFFF